MDRRDTQVLLLQDLVAAPGTQDGWHRFLDHLCDALSGSAASFISHDLKSGQGGISITTRTAPEALALYQQHWHKVDPWAHSPRIKQVKPGGTVIGDQLIDHRQIAHTGFYNDFGRQYDIVQCLAGMIEMSGSALTCVSINRPESLNRFDAEDSALIDSLVPHVQQAVRVHRRLSTAEAAQRVSAELLDRLPTGVIVLSVVGQPLLVNDTARRILNRRDGLTLDRNGLRAVTPTFSAKLQQLIDQAAACSTDAAIPNGGALMLPRPSGKRELQVVASAIAAGDHWNLSEIRAAAIVFVADPEGGHEPDSVLLARLFGLTPTEAMVALGLARGERLEEIADDLSISLGTVRWHVKHVLAKARVRSQAQLVRLVLASPASLHGHSH